MKTKTALFILLIALLSCGGSKKENGNSNDEQNPVEETQPEVETIDEDNPFETLVASYSPQQLRQLLGKTEPQDVRDFLALLPDSLCYDYSAADRRKVAQGERVGEFGGMALGEVDIANGYLNLSGAWEGTWEMFAKKEGKTWRIAVNQQYCGPMCYTHIAETYTFEDGKLTQHNYANLAGYQDVWVELFIDFDQLTQEQQDAARRVWEENNNVLFRLPRDGKTISMYVDALPYFDEGIPEEAFKEVTAVMWE